MPVAPGAPQTPVISPACHRGGLPRRTPRALAGRRMAQAGLRAAGPRDGTAVVTR